MADPFHRTEAHCFFLYLQCCQPVIGDAPEIVFRPAPSSLTVSLSPPNLLPLPVGPASPLMMARATTLQWLTLHGPTSVTTLDNRPVTNNPLRSLTECPTTESVAVLPEVTAALEALSLDLHPTASLSSRPCSPIGSRDADSALSTSVPLPVTVLSRVETPTVPELLPLEAKLKIDLLLSTAVPTEFFAEGGCTKPSVDIATLAPTVGVLVWLGGTDRTIIDYNLS